MNFCYKRMAAIVLACSGFSHPAFADCVITEEVKRLDPVEVGFCESDVVFVGKVEIAVETIRAFTEEGSATTKHFRIQRSTVLIVDRYKGAVADKVTMVADLYAKDSAYTFESGRSYLVFAKRLAGDNEYSGASAVCSLQSTLLIDAADSVLKQLEQHKNGRKKIDCKNIRSKD